MGKYKFTIEYYCENGKLHLGLNDNIKIIEEYFDLNKDYEDIEKSIEKIEIWK